MLEWSVSLLIVLSALVLRPWRMLANPQLLTPLLAALAILPLLWSLPLRHALPLQLQWSGACFVLLSLGWPLAVLTLTGVAALTWLIAPLDASGALALLLWQGLVPATLALGLGALLRHWLPQHPFVYVLGRGFLGTVLCLFTAGLLSHWSGHTLPGISTELSWVARWLMAWGDGFVTGMLSAIFVAFRPQWLATWSDALYLRS